MNIGIDQLTAQLQSALGTDAVESDPHTLAGYSVDGKQPIVLCLPEAPEQVAAALRICADAQALVTPRGGGTAVGLGNPPSQVDVVIGLQRLNNLIEHDHVNLTATAQAGMRLSNLQETLSLRNQFLAIDPPKPSQATIGGLVAANINGPRRMFYGGVRDLVIGMKMALISGKLIKAGGKVVKNVAGYDMCKLFVGSLGTLGVITEATFKMAPIPESAATLVASGPWIQATRLIDELSRSSLLPAALTFLNAEAAKTTRIARGMPAVAVWAEGFEAAVTRHLRDVQAMAEQGGLGTEILRNGDHTHFWDQIRDFPLKTDGIVYRITVPPASLAEVMDTVRDWETPESHLRIMGDAGTGILWVASQADSTTAGWFTELTSLTQRHGGHAVLFAAPPNLKAGLDVWGPSPPSLAIMRGIKQQFDPHGLLNPGRFIAGL